MRRVKNARTEAPAEQARLQAETHCKLPTTDEGWSLLARKDALTLCRELLGPEDAAAFAEYLSEKAIKDLLTQDTVLQDKRRRGVQAATTDAQVSIREINWPASAIDSRVLELWTGDHWACLVVSSWSCVRNALMDITGAGGTGAGCLDPHVMIREGSCWRRVAVRTLDSTNTSAIALLFEDSEAPPPPNRAPDRDSGTMLQMAFDWDGRMFVGERVIRLKKLLMMQVVREAGVEVSRLSSRMFKLQCGDEACYVDLDALGRGPYGWQVSGWTRVGNAQVSLCRGSLTHLSLPCTQ